MVYFEDLVEGRVDRFGDKLVLREEVIDFASKYDPQPFHLSDEAAAKTHFGRLAASGWHSACMAMRMLVDFYNETGWQGLGGGGVDEMRLLRPVYPGDRLRCEAEVHSLARSRSKPDRGRFTGQLRMFNQDDVLVMRFNWSAMIRVREPLESSS